MQLYHHPYSLDSQKVRLALEEHGIDYTSYHVNPLTGKNMDCSFFRMNPSGKLPVFQNGPQVFFRPSEIVMYIDRVIVSLEGKESAITQEVMYWIRKVEEWNPMIFTLSHIPTKYRCFVSKFLRRVAIARMSEAPDLASVYHVRLRDAYGLEDKLKDPDIVKQSEEEIATLLDDAERQLEQKQYLAGEEFTLADTMFVPVLVRLILLNLKDEYISCRPKVAEYYELVKRRPSYRKAIGKHFGGWRRYRTLTRTACYLGIRSLFRRY